MTRKETRRLREHSRDIAERKVKVPKKPKVQEREHAPDWGAFKKLRNRR
jgi:hypothetical protein